MRIVWSEPAIADLEAVHDYIARDSPDRASHCVQQLIQSVRPLRDFPQMGRIVPEGDGRQREIIHAPYRLIYRVSETEIYVLTVVHGSRDLAALLEEP